MLPGYHLATSPLLEHTRTPYTHRSLYKREALKETKFASE